jgi:hypothetical protein
LRSTSLTTPINSISSSFAMLFLWREPARAAVPR